VNAVTKMPPPDARAVEPFRHDPSHAVKN